MTRRVVKTTDTDEAWKLLRQLVVATNAAREYHEACEKVVKAAITANSEASGRETALVMCARDLLTALVGGSGTSKHMPLKEMVEKARELL